jgi:dihydropteroate synthase
MARIVSDRTAPSVEVAGRLHVRVLDLDTSGAAGHDASRAGPGRQEGAAGIREARRFAVRLDGVPAETNAVLEREIRAVGGDASAAPGPTAARPGGAALVLVGTREQFDALREALSRADAGLPDVGKAVGAALGHRLHRAERVVEGLHRSFTVGSRTAVMGVINVTPDSFSDGGRFLEPEAAVAHAVRLASEGADLLDIGGESTRPGAVPVSPDAEWRRVAPVLARLHGRVDVPISIDTRRPEVARRALEAGADIVNDVAGLRDPEMRRVVARTGAAAIVMHMRGEPATMQADLRYDDLVSEVFDWLADACERAESEGIAPAKLLVDPGLGFGKAPEHNLELVAHLGEFRSLGYPLLVGASRKSFLGWVLGGASMEEREEAGLAAAVAASLRGADIVRVHDVRPTVRALALADRLRDIVG